MKKFIFALLFLLLIATGTTIYFANEYLSCKNAVLPPVSNNEEVDSLKDSIAFLNGALSTLKGDYTDLQGFKDSVLTKKSVPIRKYPKFTPTQKDSTFEKLVGVPTNAPDTVIRDIVNVKLLVCDSIETELGFTKLQIKNLTAQVNTYEKQVETQDELIDIYADSLSKQAVVVFRKDQALQECKDKKKRRFWQGLATGVTATVGTIVTLIIISN